MGLRSGRESSLPKNPTEVAPIRLPKPVCGAGTGFLGIGWCDCPKGSKGLPMYSTLFSLYSF
ncbi:hypothetical protein CP8484711_0672 [Chlamydia psittaci 84-8471/1]|nr:hypothetical protein CP01DC11_0017 [Chlamydia psittaci 01DC11]EPJ21075.1 hypothetical protein CP02DC23_0015 [Chlamydia psittaci 02DC23]EPP39144.1 hypothetical protein CP8484711_0672 [Chlamydia psittaci 84-8471/1]